MGYSGPGENFKHGFVMGTGVDIAVRLGFCPDHVLVVQIGVGIETLWYRTMPADSELSRVAAGDRTYSTDKGIKPIMIEGVLGSEVVTELESADYFRCNGFQIEDDSPVNINATALHWYAWGSGPYPIRAVHDGGNTCNTYLEDSSLDFRDLGVTPGFVIINATNDDRGVVASVEKPTDKSRYCRLNIGGGVAGADIDDDDVCYVMPPEDEQTTAITAMT